jgi:hypothetical protein
MTTADVMNRLYRVYLGSDGDATKALYAELEALGPAGIVAVNLFRAAKNSERAKKYRGGGYRGAAYDRKQWAMDNLCGALTEHANRLNIPFGWGEDPEQPFHNQVLYVELPSGQVSFHTAVRGKGPTHDREWDGVKGVGPDRVIRWIARLLDDASAEVTA